MNKKEKKMIEDMARVLCGRTNKCHECVMPLTPICGYKSYCEILYNADYRRVVDDEIVIKKSEYEKKLNEYYEEGRASAFGDIEEQKDVRVLTKEEFYSLKPTLIYDFEAIDKAKQETTREILQEIKKEIEDIGDWQPVYDEMFARIANRHGIELE